MSAWGEPSLFEAMPPVAPAPAATPAEKPHHDRKTSVRPYQRKAINAIFLALKEHRSTLAVLATGAGKTVIFSHLIEEMKEGRVLVLAHRDELIQQARRQIARITGERPTVEKAELCANPHARIVVSSIQTQSTKNIKSGKFRRELFDPKQFGLLIIDEAHRAAAKTYRDTILYYQNGNPDLKLLGVTATPDRHDQQALGKVFESVAYRFPIYDAIAQGWLAPVKQRSVTVVGLDLSKVRTTGGDLNGAELAALLEFEETLHRMAAPVIELSAGRQTLIFCASVAHADRFAEILNRHKSGSAACVTGETKEDARRELFRNFGAGKFQFLCNVDVCTEGTDIPGVQVVAMARPTKSRSKFEQMVGRGLRPHDSLAHLLGELPSDQARTDAIAASPKPHCIALGQRVLTNVGLVPIQNVSTEMLLWDGAEFVEHDGVISRGFREVIKYAGIIATPDHRVWTEEGWKEIGKCAAEQTSISVTGIGRKAIREVDGHFRGYRSNKGSSSNCCEMHGLWGDSEKRLFELDAGNGRLSQVRAARARTAMAYEAMQLGEESLRQPQFRLLPEIRRSWHSVQVSSPHRNGYLDHKQPWFVSRNDVGSDRQRRPLRAGQPSLGGCNDSKQQPARTTCDSDNSSVQAGASACWFFRRSSSATLHSGINFRTNTSKSPPARPVQGTVEVFDIVNAGPRRRFTVEGLLVSNCEIVDFVGNAGRHKLVTVADVLGGNYSEEVKVRAAKKAQKESEKSGVPADVAKALQDAQEDLNRAAARKQQEDEQEKKRRERVKGMATYQVRDIDPFDKYDIRPPQERTWHKMPAATEKQVAFLSKLGVKIQAEKISKGEAGRLITELKAKIPAHGWQKRALLQAGYSPAEVSKLTIDGAFKLMDEAKKPVESAPVEYVPEMGGTL